MALSEKQLAANRENAKKSTGPKTEEGKQRSAMNGMRHGLTGAAFIITDEDRKAWDRFSEPFIESFQPANMAERQFAELIAQDHFRLARVPAIEANTFALGHCNKAGDCDADHEQVYDAMVQARAFRFDGQVYFGSAYELFQKTKPVVK